MIKVGDIFNQVDTDDSGIEYTHEVIKVYVDKQNITKVRLLKSTGFVGLSNIGDVWYDVPIEWVNLSISNGFFTNPLYPEFFIENEII